MFDSGLETDMAEIGCVRDHSAQNIAEHGTVDFAVLGFGRSTCPADVEDVGDVCEWRELLFGVPGIGYVALNILDWMVGVPAGPWPTSYPVNLPWTAGGVG